MTQSNIKDWQAIAKSPKFVELQRKKNLFLFSWWVVGALSYFTLLLAAVYTPELFKMKVFGRINLGYLLCLFQFLLCWGIAMYYAHRANEDFDRLTADVLSEIDGGDR